MLPYLVKYEKISSLLCCKGQKVGVGSMVLLSLVLLYIAKFSVFKKIVFSIFSPPFRHLTPKLDSNEPLGHEDSIGGHIWPLKVGARPFSDQNVKI